MTDSRLGDILVGQGLLTEAQLKEALEQAEIYGLRLGQALVIEGLSTEEQIADALASKFHLDRVSLANLRIDVALLNRVRTKNVKRLRIIPIEIEMEMGRETLVVATAHPENVLQVDELRATMGLSMKVKVATESDISKIITQVFGKDTVQSTADMGLLDVCFTQFARSTNETLMIQENQIPTVVNMGNRRPPTLDLNCDTMVRMARSHGLTKPLDQYREILLDDLEEFLAGVLDEEAFTHCNRVGGCTHVYRDAELGRFKFTVQEYRSPDKEQTRSSGTYSICIDRIVVTHFG